MIPNEWTNPTTPHPELCECAVCIAADLALLCRTPDPLARIAASLDRPTTQTGTAA